MSLAMQKSLRKSIWALPLLFLIISPLLLPDPAYDKGPYHHSLPAVFGLSVLGYKVTADYLIPLMAPHFLARGLHGSDFLKRDKKLIPESLGLVCAGIYILLLTIYIPIPFTVSQRAGTSSLPTHLAALLSLLTATFLGFLDDLFDIRWRFKLPIPVIASIPLLTVYFAEGGSTYIIPPTKFLREFVGDTLHLGPVYFVFMAMLSTFCTNSINILAGINGVEVGQGIVISASVLLNDALYLALPLPIPPEGWPGRILAEEWSRNGLLSRGSRVLAERHATSATFMMPLLGVSLALFKWNRYPAQVFSGDTYCYFAGMAFATVAILGHFSKTMLLFFIPQTFNFIISIPQLAGLVPCPRHRVPMLDTAIGLLVPSLTTYSEDAPAKPATIFILKTLSMFGITKLKLSDSGRIQSSTNLTLLNYILLRTGSKSEKELTNTVMWIQILSSGLGMAIRYQGASLMYDGDRH